MAAEIPAPTGADDRILAGVAAAACASHGDEAGFRERARAILTAAAALDMAPFRRGRWVSGGDPSTYTIPIAIARLATGHHEAEALAIVNDDRSRRETYHFAAVGWGRLIPLFHDRIAPETRSVMTAIPGNWLGGRGTDNHEVMWRSAAITLSSYRGGRVRGLDWLKTYVRTLIAAGQAEWDSPRYQPYVLQGLLNIYDFSSDDVARAWAKAGLDYIAAASALRHTGNIYAGPTSRGNSHGPGAEGMDAITWLWWGGPGGPPERSGHLRPAVYPSTSTYRPPAVIGNIARRRVPQLPFVIEQGIANYWTGLDGPSIAPIPNQGHATIWVSRHATLGTAWYADDVCSQMIHLRAAATDAAGSNAASIVAGWPGLKDGQRTLSEGHCAVFGRRDNPQRHPYVRARHGQFAQVENLAVCLAEFPDDAPDPWTYVMVRGRSRQEGAWQVFSLGAATVAVFPLGDLRRVSEGRDDLLRIDGRRSGFVLAMWDDAALEAAGVRDPWSRIAVDAGRWPQEQSVGIRTLTGTTAVITRAPESHMPSVVIEGQEQRHDQMYRSPYVNSAGSRLSISDGRDGYVIDVSGDVPVYGRLPGASSAAEQAPTQRRQPASPRRGGAGPDAEQIAAWRESVRLLLAEALAAGQSLVFAHERLGHTEVREVQGARLLLQAGDIRMAMPLRSFSHRDMAALAGAVTSQGGLQAHAMQAAFLRLAGDRTDAYHRALRAAGAQADIIMAAWAEE